ncbi:MAG: hypothetical protein KatS3mg111_1374 [Pirellulaceae bacterium]|nr:MAG: hypothetical protein KatS3mg111_1374 [Pirellulaceae bacterium]
MLSAFRRFLCLLGGVSILVAVCPADGVAQKRKQKLPSQQFKGYGLPEVVKKPVEKAIDVAPVQASRRDECRQQAARIDALVAENLKRHGLEPNPVADDYTFVRRAFLDGVGAIPTLPQTVAYAQNSDARKHEELVDELLSSPGYVSHMYNFWANILRIKDRPENNILAYGFRHWVKEQLRINRPYDEWVYEMLTAEGKIWENPAVGYTLRDNGMPLVHVDNTVRVFLGTQIGCAQCHDHPFDDWTQLQFYQLAAFTHGVRTRDGGGSPAFANGNPVQRIRDELTKQDPDKRLAGSMNLLMQANLFRVSFDAKRKLKLPHDYQYDNGKPNQPVTAQVLWGEIPDHAKSASPREQFAAWLTDPHNPRFAKTIANRLWKRVMGVGLIEPVDDLRDDSPCANPELLDFLTAEMIRLDFNIKEFLRTLMYTETYRRASSDFDPSLAEFYHFPGPRLRRMTAEQIWDSILTLAVYNPVPYELPSVEEFSRQADLDLAAVSVEELESRAQQFDETVAPRAITKMMNVASYRRQILARASELPSPLPPDHFLRQFGQCDRETIEGDSTDPTVPQILTMFNGPFTHMMLEKGSVIYDNLLRARTPREALDVMFLSILNRPPTSRDRDVAMKELARGDRAMGYGNIVWALINTREFIFVQ